MSCLEASDPHPLRLGMIPYWNLWPLCQEIQKHYGETLDLKVGHPKVVNQWLSEGAIDLAPSSSICLIHQTDMEMALPLGVSSDGPVKSVYLGLHKDHMPMWENLQERREQLAYMFRKAQSLYEGDIRQGVKYVLDQLPPSVRTLPPSSIPSLLFSKSSATSNALAKLFYGLWFGKEATRLFLTPSSSPSFRLCRPLELVIGDEALVRRPSFYKVLDLGALWKDMTGLPFVFAVWQSKGACLNGWRRKIQELGHKAERRMNLEPQAYLPTDALWPIDEQGKKIDLKDYWRSIYYKMGPREFRGLLYFLCLVRHTDAIPLDHAVMAKILRWQDLSLAKSSPVVL